MKPYHQDPKAMYTYRKVERYQENSNKKMYN